MKISEMTEEYLYKLYTECPELVCGNSAIYAVKMNFKGENMQWDSTKAYGNLTEEAHAAAPQSFAEYRDFFLKKHNAEMAASFRALRAFFPQKYTDEQVKAAEVNYLLLNTYRGYRTEAAAKNFITGLGLRAVPTGAADDGMGIDLLVYRGETLICGVQVKNTGYAVAYTVAGTGSKIAVQYTEKKKQMAEWHQKNGVPVYFLFVSEETGRPERMSAAAFARFVRRSEAV